MGHTAGIPLLSNMENIKISVIITENTRENNIEELQAQLREQTLETAAYEVILESALEDDNASAARNRGLDRAKGRYVVFLDSQNRLQPEALEYLLAMIEPQEGMGVYPMSDDKGKFLRQPVDMASCGYVIQYGMDIVDYSPEKNVKVLDQEDAMCRHFYVQNYEGYLWNKIFRKSLIDAGHVKFHEDIYQNEDRLFIMEYLKYAELVRMAPEHMVGYALPDEEDEVPSEEQAQYETEPSVGNDDHATPEELQQFERELTGLKAFQWMRKLLKGRRHEDSRWLCNQDMAFEALQKYFEVLQAPYPEDYSRTSLRKYAKKMKKLDFLPSTEEDAELLQSFLNFGATGKMEV